MKDEGPKGYISLMRDEGKKLLALFGKLDADGSRR